jgi:hypothetical protein
VQPDERVEDAAEHLAGHLVRGLGVLEQLLHLALDQLTTLGELVAGPAGEVFPQAARLGLARAASQVAVLHQVGQPGLDRVDVKVASRSARRWATSAADWSDISPEIAPVNVRMIAR